MTYQQAGHGFGLRTAHYPQLLQDGVAGVDLIEAVTENFLDRGGRPFAVLERVRSDVPVILHGVSMSIGGVDPLNARHLESLRALCDRIEPLRVSDHLCFGTVSGQYGHDLWPLPFTEECLSHVIDRIGRIQDTLGRNILVENVSSYVTYAASSLHEWEFLNEVARRSGCGVLLDVNNVYVSSRNHGFSAEVFIDSMNPRVVGQLHLAGHSCQGDHLLDDHGSEVPDPVWALYERTVARIGTVPTIVEWDENVPVLPRLIEETRTARRHEEMALRAREPQLDCA